MKSGNCLMEVVDFMTESGFRAAVIPGPEDVLEIRYWDVHGDDSYRAWKIPAGLVEALGIFWRSYRSGEFVPPAVERVNAGELRMMSGKNVSVKEADRYGRLKMSGAELPSDLVAALSVRY